MTIDPDDYDLRELRRIADERRDARQPDVDGEGRRRRIGPRRGRRSEEPRRNGSGRRRDGRPAERSDEDRRERHPPDERGADEVTVRPRERDGRSRSRNGRSREREDSPREQDGQPRGRDGRSRRAHDGRDGVVRADRLARDLGFGAEEGDRRRDDRIGRPERRPQRDAGDRPRGDDDVGRFQFDTTVRERPRTHPDRALRENQLEQLLVHETGAADELSKPYLAALPDAYAAERLVFEWLEFLVLKGGYKRTMDALRYYRTVEWLTAEVESELRDYLVGFSGEVTDTEAYDVDDHHLSLVYIARLASMA